MNLHIADAPKFVQSVHEMLSATYKRVISAPEMDIVERTDRFFFRGDDPVTVGGPFQSIAELICSQGLELEKERAQFPNSETVSHKIYLWAGSFFRVDAGPSQPVRQFEDLDEARSASPALHPAYFTTRFRTAPSRNQEQSWPEEFAIISAYATTGEAWSEEENLTADRALYDELAALGLSPTRLTGYDPDTGHEEPSYAVALSLGEARELGAEFQQDAIFYVSGGELSVTLCGVGSELVKVGRYGERVDSAET